MFNKLTGQQPRIYDGQIKAKKTSIHTSEILAHAFLFYHFLFPRRKNLYQLHFNVAKFCKRKFYFHCSASLTENVSDFSRERMRENQQFSGQKLLY